MGGCQESCWGGLHERECAREREGLIHEAGPSACLVVVRGAVWLVGVRGQLKLDWGNVWD